MPPPNLRSALIETLLQLQDARRTGVLRLEKLKTKRQLVIQDGSLSSAESNVPDEHLARILVQERVLGNRDLNQVAQFMKTGKSTEEAILATQKVDSKKLEEAVFTQATTTLAAILAWEDYEMRFFPGEGLVRRQVSLQVPLAQFLVSTTRWMVTRRKLPSGIGKLEGMLVQSAWGRTMCTKLPLENVEAFAYSQTQQPVNTAELLPSMPVPESMRPEEPLQRLLVLGLIQFHVPAVEEAAGASRDELQEQMEEMLHKFEVSNYYEILSLPSNATDDQIRDAYHDLAKEYHPDRFQSKEFSDEFREIADKVFTFMTGAYTTLSDPAARIVYDENRAKAGSVASAAAAEKEKDEMAETLFRAGRGALAKGDFEKGVAHFRECVWLRPKVARYQHFLGVAQSEIPKLTKEAEEHLQKAIELDKTSVDSYLALGKLYLKVKLPRRAELQFQEVLKWDANNQAAQRLLESLYSGKPPDGGVFGKPRRP